MADLMEALRVSLEDKIASIRTERLAHTHIIQDETPGCAACDKINPLHMTRQYIFSSRWA